MESHRERMERIERERRREARQHAMIMWGVLICVLLFWGVVLFVAGHFIAKWW